MRWLIALGIVVAGIVVGSVVAGQVRRVISAPRRREQVRELADPLGSVAFSIVLAAGLFAGLGVADPDSLRTLPDSLIAFIPRALICALMILLGKAAATVIAAAVGTALVRATGKPQHQLTRLVRSVVFGVAIILGVSQLGVNTKVVDTLVSGLIFGAALSVSLLTGLGGRHVAGDVAAGRYLRRVINVGDRVESERGSGTVVGLHGATVELATTESPSVEPAAEATAGGAVGSTPETVTVVHVPNAGLLAATFSVTRRR